MLNWPFGASIALSIAASNALPRSVVRQDQYRRLTGPHEVARHREHEVGVVAEQSGQELISHFICDVGAPLDQRRGPAT